MPAEPYYKHLLLNLLAVIHRDGGHYETEHGTARACADAEKIVIAERNKDDL